MTDRAAALAAAAARFDSGAFFADLAPRIAMRSESQTGDIAGLHAYLREAMTPALMQLGFTTRIVENPKPGGGPFLIAERLEDGTAPTALLYGHGDVARGQDELWSPGLSPWRLTAKAGKWYGRGVADNKGQHSINLAALAAVIETRGRLGWNAKILIETGEEVGSPGLRELAASHRAALAADVLLASDGPRVAADRPTLFLGSRGCVNFSLRLKARDAYHHSGNWGGALSNPAVVLAAAIASMIDRRGRILIEALRSPAPPLAVRRALSNITLGGAEGDPDIDPNWGEPELSVEERVFASNTLEVLAFEAGNSRSPASAVPPEARAAMQLRYVADAPHWPNPQERVVEIVRSHLDAQGFATIEATPGPGEPFVATRLDPNSPWVDWALASMAASAPNSPPALLPNLGGSIPNDVFMDVLGMPTLWAAHSYPACQQHAPDEHLPMVLIRQSLEIAAGLFWDLGDSAIEAGPGLLCYSPADIHDLS